MKALRVVGRSVFVGLMPILLVCSFAKAQPPTAPPGAPQLRIEPGLHTGPIMRIGVDRSCTLLATASQDKTVRLWRMPDGKPLGTLRPPIGTGDDGKLYSVAIAPDGSWTAVAGETKSGDDHWIYIFRNSTGDVVKLLGPTPHMARHLAVSPDGRYLAATYVLGGGLKVWERMGADLATWRLVTEDENYAGMHSFGAAFGGTGVLYTVANDGKIRRYREGYTGSPLLVETRGGRHPYSVAVHPSGDRIAVGFLDTRAVEVYDAGSLVWSFAAQGTHEGEGHLSKVAWSADGERLYGAGNYSVKSDPVILVWDQAGKGTIRRLNAPPNTIMHLLPCDNGIALGGYGPVLALLGHDNTPRLWMENVLPDMRGKLNEHFTASPDGRRIRFGLKQQSKIPILFDLTAERLTAAPELSKDLYPPETRDHSIEGWEGKNALNLAHATIKLNPDDRAIRSLAFAPDGRHILLGTDSWLRMYNTIGKLIWRKSVPGIVWGVNIPRDGKLIVAAYADGTIRWHRLEDGEQLLALFVHSKDYRWVTWTPKGFYTASAGGENLIGWHINRNWNQAADFFSVSRLRDHFYRPDIIARILSDLDEEKAITRANSLIKRRREDEDIRRRQPPVVRIVSPANHSSLLGSEITLEYTVRSPAALPIKRIFAQADGRPLPGGELLNPIRGTRGELGGKLTIKVPLRDVVLSVIAETEHASSVPASIELVWMGDAAQVAKKRRLFALVVGIGAYEKEGQRLHTPPNDADDIAAELKKQENIAFETVLTRVLKDRDPGAEATLQNIKAGLSWLRQSATDMDDIALMYFSGHGISIPGSTSYLLPVDFDGDVDVTGLDKSAMLNTLRRINGRVVVFVDACYAADQLRLSVHRGARRLNTAGLISEFADSQNGIIAFASSTGTERSYGEGRNGYFTRALLEGLRFYDMRAHHKVLLTDDLNTYLRRRVPALSGHKQTPIMQMSPVARPVPLAMR